LETEKKKARLIAFYLPQYHPIPENDEWWGKGFTEWISVAQAKPLFKGHEQPILPGELGFYDLRVSEVRSAQAELAREHGIEGFCYWHYWLGGGKRLLEMPFNEVLKSGEPDFPFCLAWANHDWKGVFFGAKGRSLLNQEYPGKQDYIDHFYAMLDAFRDKRYIEVNGKKLFYILHPGQIPDCNLFIKIWDELAIKEGLKGFHFVGAGIEPKNKGLYSLDAVATLRHRIIEQELPRQKMLYRLKLKMFQLKRRNYKVFPYKEALKFFLKPGTCPIEEYPSIVANWDTTARLREDAAILQDSTPELFRIHVRQLLNQVKHKPIEENIVFIKSWNEWAEGNYIEPDRKNGRAYLEVIKEEIVDSRLQGE
jgi:hypothetical protein